MKTKIDDYDEHANAICSISAKFGTKDCFSCPLFDGKVCSLVKARIIFEKGMVK